MHAHTNPVDWTLLLRVVGVCGSLMACVPSDQASVPATANSSPARTAPAVSPDAIAGGWSQTDTNADAVQEAARFAVQAYAVAQHSRTLYKDVIEAQQQVVDGMNFKLKLQVQHDGALRPAQVTVWRQLNGQYRLTHWSWAN